MSTSFEEGTATLSPADMSYILFCSFAVFLITPAIAMFYGGALKRSSMVQLMLQSYLVTASVAVLWYLFGFSISTSPTSTNSMIGNMKMAALRSKEEFPLYEEGTLPTIVIFCFNVFFPIATVQIFVGSIGERGRLLPSIVVGLLFVIAVYCPMAYSVWGPTGWLLELGALDFAGGGPVHISSGVASMCYSWYLGPRGGKLGQRTGTIPKYRGHSQMTTFLGVTLIWGAWFCFNSGTLLAVNPRTGYIFANTFLAGCFAMLAYVATDKILTGKYSVQAACEGVIVGLVNITPSCGFYYPWATAVTSILTATFCRLLEPVNEWTGIDDYSKSGVVHGIGGIFGGIFTGIFASKHIASTDGYTEIDGGWIDGHWIQLGYELAAIVTMVAWTAVFTLIILYVVDHIPGLRIRATPEEEEMGMDLYEMAETLDEFGNDYDEFFKAYIKFKSMKETYEVVQGVEVTSESSPVEIGEKTMTQV